MSKPEAIDPGSTALAWIGPQPPAEALPTRLWRLWPDSDAFLLSPDAYAQPLYVVQTRQRGVAGLALITLLRERTEAGIVALARRPSAELPAALDAGADLVLPADAPPEHLLAALRAVQRRCGAQQAQAARAALPVDLPWTLLEDTSVLQSPDGARIPLSGAELQVMQCFAAAPGHRVERRLLLERLWGAGTGPMDNALQATLYRLRRRIEQASRWPAPVHAVARVGYEFRAPLKVG